MIPVSGFIVDDRLSSGLVRGARHGMGAGYLGRDGYAHCEVYFNRLNVPLVLSKYEEHLLENTFTVRKSPWIPTIWTGGCDWQA